MAIKHLLRSYRKPWIAFVTTAYLLCMEHVTGTGKKDIRNEDGRQKEREKEMEKE